MTTVSTQMWKL